MRVVGSAEESTARNGSAKEQREVPTSLGHEQGKSEPLNNDAGAEASNDDTQHAGTHVTS